MLNEARHIVCKDYSLSGETIEKLDILVSELHRWQKIKNLVGPATLEHVWSRHIADSLQLFALAPFAKSWLDLGSGAGFPGLVLAILGTGRGLHVTMVESNARKCSFMRNVTRLIEVPATILSERLENVIPSVIGKVEIVSARALAALDQLLGWTEPLLSHGAIGVFPKGREVETELEIARQSWDFDYQILPSRVDPDSSIVKVTSAVRAK